MKDWAKNIGLTLLINNIFSEKYESNGATYPDIESGKVVNYDYFYPPGTGELFTWAEC